MILTILGAPGSGKGTMAGFISTALKIPTISTGALLRDEINSGSELGQEIDKLISKGNFVTDEMIIPILKKRIAEKDCANGCILDGFPRNTSQAEKLSEIGVNLDKALLLKVTDEDVLMRLLGRRECPKCRATYHITYNAPATDDVCDKCQSKLRMRADDKPEIILKRLSIYHKETEPLINYFKGQNILVTAKGEITLKNTRENVFKALEII